MPAKRATTGGMVVGSAGPRQVLVFLNPFSATGMALAERVARSVTERAGWRLGAFVDGSRHRPPAWPLLVARRLGAVAARRCFGPWPGGSPPPGTFLAPGWLARRFRAPLLVPEGRDVNSPGFRERLLREWRGAVALVSECLQVFGDELLSLFEAAVNYHDGALPAYRGVAATAWSVYRGETESGFTFHRMSTGIDAGSVLVEGSVAVPPDASAESVKVAKTRAAMASLPCVLDALERGEPGRVQAGPAGYFSRAARRRIAEVPDPSALTEEELRRRLRAFGVLEMTLGGAVLPVTALTRARSRRGAFVSRDGVALRAHRLLHLPPVAYRAVAMAMRRHPR